ncbi:hypothetical protein FHS28_000508 [Roseateles terrae]|uniref:Uncharacterized protein n=1 Tax=Roseateles terrae TaxID=431060 RepID=A0ABR6GM04_9BURK|nr:hypothetical protein [Roseateles terrae]
MTVEGYCQKRPRWGEVFDQVKAAGWRARLVSASERTGGVVVNQVKDLHSWEGECLEWHGLDGDSPWTSFV